jgi:hypothetical protein
MAMRRNFRFLFLSVVGLLLFVVSILSSACSPPQLVNEYRKMGTYPYPSELKSTVAYLVLEMNDQPAIMASGYLVNKEKGIFINAKHFTDEFGKFGPDYCKLFFNGKVYRAEIIKVPPLRDASLLKIVSDFDPADFPDPLPFAKEMPKLGEKVHILGFHPHVYNIREQNAKEGFADRVIPIFRTYYDVVMKDKSKETEVVFDDLIGTRVSPVSDVVDETLLTYENDSFIKLQMDRDHKFSFGGLSGGLATNSRGEIVGVITAQDPFRFEFDENGYFMLPNGDIAATVKKHKFDIVYVTPSSSLQDLKEYVK